MISLNMPLQILLTLTVKAALVSKYIWFTRFFLREYITHFTYCRVNKPVCLSGNILHYGRQKSHALFCKISILRVTLQLPVEGFMISLCCLCGTEGASLSTRMKEILEKHNQRFTHLWEGFMGSRQTCRLEQLSRLKQCSMSLFGLFSEESVKQLRLLHSNAPDRFVPASPNINPAHLRWSSCCAHAVDSFTWGWSASWPTFHLLN